MCFSEVLAKLAAKQTSLNGNPRQPEVWKGGQVAIILRLMKLEISLQFHFLPKRQKPKL